MRLKRARALLLAGSGVAMLLMGLLFFTVRSQTHAAAPVITGLHVSGNQLLNGNGDVIRLLGVDRSGAEYQCVNGNNSIFEGPVDQASVNAMLAWHINAVRIPLNEDCWLGINGVNSSVSGTAYQQAIVSYVNLLNANGLAVILDLHWNAPGTQLANAQQPMPDADHAPAFWTSVATTFKSNSSVIFDLYNEPHDDNGTCWRDGGSACTNTGFTAVGMQSLVNTVRATGSTNVIMLTGWGYGNWIGDWLTYEPNDPLHNLMASAHIYSNSGCNNVGCYDTYYKPVVQKVPVVFGEIGEGDCAHSFIDTVMNWADQNGVGYLGWAWNVQNCSTFPALISNYNGTPTGFGAGLHDHLASLANGSGPTPTPSPTPTSASSTPTPTPTTGGSTPTPTPTVVTNASCSVHYAIVNSWPGGFQAGLTITNTGSTSINGWTLQFSFANGQTITQLWNGNYTQNGSTVSVTNLSYNGTIPAGSQLSSQPGFLGTWNGTNAVPAAFTLNGSSCSVV